MLVNYIGVYWLLSGILTAKWAHGIRWKAGTRIGLAAGVLGIGTGLALLARHALDDVVSPATLIGVVALTTVATGCLRLLGAFEVEERSGRRWTVGGLILGFVEVCLGAMLFLARDAHAPAVRTTIGVWGLVAGILLLVQGVRMLHVRRAIG
jgi:uncharacterized membrane protein HdeD (DUF308 family)